MVFDILNSSQSTEEVINNYTTRMHTNLMVDTFFAILSLIMIWKFSPKAMGNYKYFLANITICSFLLDIHSTLIHLPLPLVPAMGFCTLGVARPLGFLLGNCLQICLLMELIGFCGSSLISAFIYRYAAATDKLHWFNRRKIWTCIILLHLFLGLPAALSFWVLILYYNRFSPDFSHEIMLKYFPELKSLYEDPDQNCLLGVVSIEYPLTVAFIIVMSCSIICAEGILAYFLFGTLSYLKKLKTSLSGTTTKMQKQLTVALILQSIVPTCSLVLPFLGTVLMVFVNNNISNEFSRLAFEIVTLHSTFNTISMLVLTPCYREVLLKPYYHIKRKIFPQLHAVASAPEIVSAQIIRHS